MFALDANDVGQQETGCQSTVDVGRGAGSCNDGELKNIVLNKKILCFLCVFYAFKMVVYCKGSQINFTCKFCLGAGSILRPSNYEKSVLTSRTERCAICCKSATGICRYITLPNPSTLWRWISVGLELRHRKCWLPCCKCWLPLQQRFVDMLQGLTYTVMLPFTSTSCWNFVVCSDHGRVIKCKGFQSIYITLLCCGLGLNCDPRITRKAS